MSKQEAFRIVLDELCQCNLFCGNYDAKNGNKKFMYGIACVMESIADMAADSTFSDTFLDNMIRSEDEVEKCKNCERKRTLKKLVDHEWQYELICTLFIDEPDGYAVSVTEDDRCEMFMPRKEDNE